LDPALVHVRPHGRRGREERDPERREDRERLLRRGQEDEREHHEADEWRGAVARPGRDRDRRAVGLRRPRARRPPPLRPGSLSLRHLLNRLDLTHDH
jgi:hypothetical protein